MLIEDAAFGDAALAGAPVALVPIAIGVCVGSGAGVAVGGAGGVAVAVGTGVGAGSGVAVAGGGGVGVGSGSSAVPQAAMSGSRAVSKMATVMVMVALIFPMVLESRLAGNFTLADKMGTGCRAGCF